MAAAVRYVRKRGSVFQYERRVPTKIVRHGEAWRDHFNSQALWRRSLQTTETAELFAAAEAVHHDFERRKHAALALVNGVSSTPSATPLVTLTRLSRPVTKHDLEILEADARRRESRYFEQLYLTADSDPARADWLADHVEQYELDAAERRAAIVIPGFDDVDRPWLPSPVREARAMIDALGLDAPEASPTFGAIVAAIRRGYLAGAHDVNEILAGRAKPSIAAEPESPAPQAPTLSEAVAAYITHKRPKKRTITQIRTCMRELIDMVGDKPLDALSRADFEAYVQFRANRVVGTKSKDAVERPAALDTVKKSLGLLRAAIGHVIDHRDFAFEGPNPAVGIKVETYVQRVDKAVMPDKRPLRVGELNKLLQHPWFTGCASAKQTHASGDFRLTGAEYWAPIVAMHTGTRLSELGGLRIAETLLDDPHPHLVIRDNEYRTTKKGYARCVPVLDVLFELGFADYVERIRDSGADRLFPDWVAPVTGNNDDDDRWYNSRLVRAFNRTVVKKQLGSTLLAGARQEVTWHSFRGAFKSMLGASRYRLHPNIINEVIGHAKSEMDQRYIGTVPIEETYPAIRACRYERLVLPDPPRR